jgi:hypothetical protein
MASQALDHDSRGHGTTLQLHLQQLLDAPILPWQFLERQPRGGRELIFGRTFTLIQHIRELFLGSTLKSNELKPKSITILPSDDGE